MFDRKLSTKELEQVKDLAQSFLEARVDWPDIQSGRCVITEQAYRDILKNGAWRVEGVLADHLDGEAGLDWPAFAEDLQAQDDGRLHALIKLLCIRNLEDVNDRIEEVLDSAANLGALKLDPLLAFASPQVMVAELENLKCQMLPYHRAGIEVVLMRLGFVQELPRMEQELRILENRLSALIDGECLSGWQQRSLGGLLAAAPWHLQDLQRNLSSFDQNNAGVAGADLALSAEGQEGDPLEEYFKKSVPALKRISTSMNAFLQRLPEGWHFQHLPPE